MRSQENVCPVRIYKDREGITYRELADRLGLTEDYARKLGCGGVPSVSPKLALQVERRSHRRIKYREMMEWVRRNLEDADAAA